MCLIPGKLYETKLSFWVYYSAPNAFQKNVLVGDVLLYTQEKVLENNNVKYYFLRNNRVYWVVYPPGGRHFCVELMS